jgi:outer membrane protein TolC
MIKKIYFSSFLTICLFVGVSAQDSILTLQQAIQTGIHNNFTLKEMELDVRKAKSGISESRAKLLPVIEGFGNFQDNIQRGIQITDGATLSKLLYPITHTDIPYMENKGLRYNTSVGVQLGLSLFNQTIYASINLADKMQNLSKLNYEKAKEDLTVEICKIYYLGQITTEQIDLIQKNKDALAELSGFTQAFHENGMALDVDMKRVQINLENLNVQYESAKVLYEQQINLLKYMLDLPVESSFELEKMDTLGGVGDIKSGISDNLYELKMLDMQQEILWQQKKVVNANYLPSLSLVSQFAELNSVDKFSKYFHNELPNDWHTSFYFGLSLKVPLFDGLAKKYQTDKLNADLQKADFVRKDVHRKLDTQYQNLLFDCENARRNAQRQRDNYLLAEDVYSLTVNRYKEGLASMSELLQDEMSKNNAQNNYLSAFYQCKISELGLMKLSGKLIELY